MRKRWRRWRSKLLGKDIMRCLKSIWININSMVSWHIWAALRILDTRFFCQSWTPLLTENIPLNKRWSRVAMTFFRITGLCTCWINELWRSIEIVPGFVQWISRPVTAARRRYRKSRSRCTWEDRRRSYSRIRWKNHIPWRRTWESTFNRRRKLAKRRFCWSHTIYRRSFRLSGRWAIIGRVPLISFVIHALQRNQLSLKQDQDLETSNYDGI